MWIWLCRVGLHRWRHDHGAFNRYYECRRCRMRRVTLGRGGYQPVAIWWLDRSEPPLRLPPNAGSGVMRRIIVEGWIKKGGVNAAPDVPRPPPPRPSMV
jgi:hypothetical protein